MQDPPLLASKNTKRRERESRDCAADYGWLLSPHLQHQLCVDRCASMLWASLLRVVSDKH